MKKRVYLIDVDGTTCSDIKNEESHLYATAKVEEGAVEVINELYDNGNVIVFFTARESKDREITEKWLNDHGFKYHGMMMDKPRIMDKCEYVWIDNVPTRAITYKGKWSSIIEKDIDCEDITTFLTFE